MMRSWQGSEATASLRCLAVSALLLIFAEKVGRSVLRIVFILIGGLGEVSPCDCIFVREIDSKSLAMALAVFISCGLISTAVAASVYAPYDRNGRFSRFSDLANSTEPHDRARSFKKLQRVARSDRRTSWMTMTNFRRVELVDLRFLGFHTKLRWADTCAQGLETWIPGTGFERRNW